MDIRPCEDEDRSSAVCSSCVSRIPAALKLWRRPSAWPSPVVKHSHGSATRRRLKGRPNTAASCTAGPEGAASSSCSASTPKRHTCVPSLVVRKPHSGGRRFSSTRPRSRESIAKPTPAPMFTARAGVRVFSTRRCGARTGMQHALIPKSTMTTWKSKRNLLRMLAGFRCTTSLMVHVAM